jgi:hypothetical protein
MIKELQNSANWINITAPVAGQETAEFTQWASTTDGKCHHLKTEEGTPIKGNPESSQHHETNISIHAGHCTKSVMQAANKILTITNCLITLHCRSLHGKKKGCTHAVTFLWLFHCLDTSA